jgi:hypothetical protein
MQLHHTSENSEKGERGAGCPHGDKMTDKELEEMIEMLKERHKFWWS